MKVQQTNRPTAEPCPTCGTHTTACFRVVDRAGAEDDETVACGECIGGVIRSHNDGRYGLRDWNQRQEPLPKEDIKRVLDTRFIRTGYGIGRGFQFCRFRHHFETLREVAEDEEVYAAGERAYPRKFWPTFPRQAVLIDEHQLLETWDELTVKNRLSGLVRNIHPEDLPESIQDALSKYGIDPPQFP